MSLDRYTASKAAFDDHVASLNRLSDLLSDVAAGLKSQPGRLSFSNTSGALPLAARTSPDALSFDALAWKPAAQIQEMLARWHELRSELLASWLALPIEARAEISAPEGAAAYVAAAWAEGQRRSDLRRTSKRAFLLSKG